MGQISSYTEKGSIAAGDEIPLESDGNNYKRDLGAELTTRDTANRDRSNHTGSQAISTVTGLQSALDAKGTQADNRARANHTGEQAISTVTGLTEALSVANVAALASIAAADVIDGGLYRTARYWAGFDRGANVYEYDAEATDQCDGGFILDGIGGDNSPAATAATYAGSGTGRFKAVFQGQANADQFGVKGDGSADDYYRAQAARNASDLVVFSPGTYKLSRSLDCTSTADTSTSGGLAIIGAGRFATTFKGGDDGHPVIDAIGRSNVYFADFGIEHDTGAAPTCGILAGRIDDAKNGGKNSYHRLFINGDFRVAAFYSLSQESTLWESCFFRNDASTRDCITFIGAQTASNHTGVDIVSRYQTITTLGAGTRNSSNRLSKCIIQNNADRAANRCVRLEKTNGWVFDSCYNYATFTTANQALIEVTLRTGNLSFYNCRQEFDGDLRGIHFIDEEASEQDVYGVEIDHCSFGPLYGDDNLRFSNLSWRNSRLYSPTDSRDVFNVWKLYNSEISALTDTAFRGSGTKLIWDGTYSVRNAADDNRFHGIDDANLLLEAKTSIKEFNTYTTADKTKSSDVDVTASSTEKLELTLPAGRYLVDCLLAYDADEAVDFRSMITTAGSSTADWAILGEGPDIADATPDVSDAVKYNAAKGSSLTTGGEAGTVHAVKWRGQMTLTAEETLEARWAQSVSSATAVTLKEGSYLNAKRIG